MPRSWCHRVVLALLGALPPALPAAAQEQPSPRAPRALASEPKVRWSFGPFAFEAEPVRSAGRVLAAGRDAGGRRTVLVLDEASGRLLARTPFPSAEPLALAAHGERVAVRTAPTRVDLFRLRGARLVAERAIVDAGGVSAPRLAEEELLVRAGAALVRYDLGRLEPAWRAEVPGALHGAPEARGARVFAGWYDVSGAAHLAAFERASGTLVADVTLGRARDGRAPAAREALRAVAHAGEVWVELAAPLPSQSGAEFAWSRVAFDGTRFGAPTLHALLAPPLELEDGWVAPERGAAGARWLRARGASDGERVLELAAPAHHAWLAACLAPASRAGDVLYLGPCAADARSLEVLWRREEAPAFRPVPLDGGLLVIADGVLRCLTAELPPPDPAVERAAARAAALERELGEEFARIAAQALRGGDGELGARLCGEAAALGANERNLARLEAEAERLAATAGAARVGTRRTALAAEETAARAKLTRALATAARNAADAGERLALLDELFRRASEDPDGLAELRRLVPASTTLAPSEARAWLEFLALARTTPIERLEPAVPGVARGLDEERLASERAAWRPDAVAYRSARLAVVTAAAPPDALARTLRSGELVCDVLEELFGGARPAAERLALVLYPTQEEYLAHSGSDLGGLESVLGFTAGHYDLGADVSRLFLPSDDQAGTRLERVAAHELTHHWLAKRARFAPPRAAADAPGYWIAEAIATFVEELALAPERGTWTHVPERAASLDTLANAPARELVPWRTLLAASYEDYTRLETRPTVRLVLDGHLGVEAPRSPMQLFYAQGAALAHYLYAAEDGRWRALLFRAVEAYSRGTPLDVAAELGATPDELGARVSAWARARIRGPRGRRQRRRSGALA